MIGKERLLAMIRELIAKEGNTDVDVSGNDISGWDSLTHLSILVALDHELDGAASAIDELATCHSSDEIYQVLLKAELAEPC